MSPSTSNRRLSRQLQIRILKHNQRGLPSQLQQHGFQVLSREFCNNAPYGGGPREIYLACGGVGDQCLDDLRGVFAAVLDDVEDAGGEARVAEELADEVVGSGGEFGGFEAGC